MIVHSALAVFRFELGRTLTVSRVAVWLLLTAFPIFIISVIKYNEGQFNPIHLRQNDNGIHPIKVNLPQGGKLVVEMRRQGRERIARVTIQEAGITRTFRQSRNPRQHDLSRLHPLTGTHR